MRLRIFLSAICALLTNTALADANSGAFYGFELGNVCVSDRVATEVRVEGGGKAKVVPTYFPGLAKPEEIDYVMQVCTPASNRLYEVVGCTASEKGDAAAYLEAIRDQLKIRYPDWEERPAGNSTFAIASSRYRITGTLKDNTAACIRFSYDPLSSEAILLKTTLEKEQADNPMLEGM